MSQHRHPLAVPFPAPARYLKPSHASSPLNLAGEARGDIRPDEAAVTRCLAELGELDGR